MPAPNAAGAAPDHPEIDLTIGDRTWSLRPSFDALVRTEAALGLGLLALMRRVERLEHGVQDVTRILYEGLRAANGNEAPSYTTVGAAVLDMGLEAATAPALELLVAAFEGLARRPDDEPATDEDTGDPR